MNEKDKNKQKLERESAKLRPQVTGLKEPESRLVWTEERIEQQASFLNLIIESLPNPFYVIDAFDYTIKLANSAARFGQISKTATCYALTHKSDKPCNSPENPCPVEKIKRSKQPVIVEHVHYDESGSQRNVEIHAFPIFDSEGSVSQIVEYVLDITERRQAEEMLKWELAVNFALSGCFKPLVSPWTSIEQMANTVLEKALSLTGSKYGYVSSIDLITGDNVGHTLTEMNKSQCGVSDKDRRLTFPRGNDGLYNGLCGHSLNTLKAFFTNSPETHEEKKGVPEGHIPIQRLLSVPVLLGEELVGQIAIVNKVDDYTERDLKAISRLAQFYALAIQRKRTEDALQESHSELERRVEERTADLLKTCNERAFIRETFGAYLSDEVVTEILTSQNGVELGGEMREMTVLVSDLVGFTTTTESMEPPQIVKIINRYLQRMIDIIVQYEGTIDEFTGDGILVFFGAPRPVPNHTKQAVVCAIEMQEAMEDLNKENAILGLPQLKMGIGIDCGGLVVGNIGSEKRMKYGAVGSPINVAFRIEEKARPGEILVTQAVKEKLGNKLQVGSHWIDRIKGTGNTAIYQVIGVKES